MTTEPETKTTTHTPGPWRVGMMDRSGITIYSVQSHPDVARVHRLDKREPECDANARLIAAAPDLLAACKAAIEWTALDGDSITNPTRLELLNAIAKAEGR